MAAPRNAAAHTPDAGTVPIVGANVQVKDSGGGERTRTADFYIANGTDAPAWPGISRGSPGHFGRRGAPKGRVGQQLSPVESRARQPARSI